MPTRLWRRFLLSPPEAWSCQGPQSHRHNMLCGRKASQALKASDLYPFCFLINNKSKKIANGCLDPKHTCVEVGKTDICQFWGGRGAMRVRVEIPMALYLVYLRVPFLEFSPQYPKRCLLYLLRTRMKRWSSTIRKLMQAGLPSDKQKRSLATLPAP